MRFYCNINANPRALVKALGSDIPITSAEVKRRDAGDVELMLFNGDGVSAAPYKLSEAFELRFKGQAKGDYGGAAAVFTSAFAWRPTDQVYRSAPSFGGLALSAMFGGATKARRYATGHTLVTGDLGGSVTVVSSVAGTVVVPPSLGAGTEKVWIIAADEEIVITAGSGVTLTTSVSATVPGLSMVMIERTGINAWTVKAAEVNGVTSVTLEGEFTWRDLAVPDDWTSTETIEVIVNNDVNQGDEAEPIDIEASTIYATKSELATGYVRTDIVQSLSPEQRAQARANMGAITDGEVVKVSAQSLSPTEKTQARTNIGGAAQADLDITNATAAALAITVAGKASLSSLSVLDATVTALNAVVLKKTTQTFSAPEKAQILANIGAQPSASERVFTRLAACFNPVGNSTTVSLDGALNTAAGTATARNVSLFDAGHTISAYAGATITSAAHGGAANQPCQFSGTLIPAGITAGVWYYLRDVTANTFAVAATAGGAAITLSGSFSAWKVHLSIGPFFRHRRIGFVSSATAGTSCGTRHSVLQWAVSADPALGGWTFSARFGISDAAAVANARMFVGLTGVASAGVLPNANPSTALNIIGVGADTGDTTLRIMHNDASGTATRIDLGASFPANTRNTDLYQLVLTCNADLSVTYKVTNLTTAAVVQGNLATDLPMSLQLLAPQLWRNNGTTALAVGLDVVQWTMEQAA